MYVAWGSYRFQNNEVGTSIDRARQVDEAGNGWANLVTWQLSGKILNPSGSLQMMAVRLAALEAAFASDGKDLRLLMPDGVSPSHHVLLTADTIGGTRVTSDVSYPDSSGANYVTYRDFTVTVQGLVPLPANGRSPLLSFQTNITFTGGGPLTYHLEPLNGRPIKGLGKQQTVWKATQSGSAVGMVGRPSPLVIDPPIWPQSEVRPLRVVTPGTPKRTGNAFVEWPISWQYTFESADQLIGSPRLWDF